MLERSNEVWEKKHDDNGPNESSNDDKSDDDTALPLESLKVLSLLTTGQETQKTDYE